MEQLPEFIVLCSLMVGLLVVAAAIADVITRFRERRKNNAYKKKKAGSWRFTAR